LSPDGAFKTLDAEIFVTVFNEEEWSFFCDALEIPELKSDIRFSNNIKRVENRKSLNALVNEIMARRPSVWWLRVLERKGVACAIAQSFEQIKYHSQVQANEMIKEVKTEKWGNVYVGGMPWHFARTPGEITPPPVPGGDTQMVLDQLKLNQYSRDLN
jgi:crotonobetainyl-CoA:carnitine CoA-transferase CaiB-like acyl-CoA transferase